MAGVAAVGHGAGRTFCVGVGDHRRAVAGLFHRRLPEKRLLSDIYLLYRSGCRISWTILLPGDEGSGSGFARCPDYPIIHLLPEAPGFSFQPVNKPLDCRGCFA